MPTQVPFTAHRRALLGFLVALLSVSVLFVPAAPAEAAKKPAKPKLVVKSKPAAVTAGTRATIKGRVRGRVRGGRRNLRVDLQRRRGRGFRASSTVRVSRKSRFALRWTAPTKPGKVRLRLRLRRGQKVLAFSRPWTVQVRRPESPKGRTQVIAPGSITAAPAPGQAGQLRVKGDPRLRPGDIVAVGIGDATPFGFLGRVTVVKRVGSETVLDTVPTTLIDAVPEGKIDQHIVNGELEGGREEQVAGRAANSGPELRRTVRSTFVCTGSRKVTVKGVVGVNSDIDIDASWGPFKGVSASFIGEVKASAELSASAEGSASCKTGPHTLFTTTLRPIQFAVGVLPVVVVPKVTVYLTAEGKVEASVLSEINGSVSAKAGLEYSDGQARPVAEFNKDFGFTPPDPQGSASLSATASPTLDLLLYGVGGPQATFNVGLAVNANPDASPRWKLTAPVSLTAKLVAPVLKISTGTLTVYQNEFLLAQEGDESGEGAIGFDEYPEGTTISNQYANLGVVFDSSPFTTGDGANPTSPVLSGQPRFEGPISGYFVQPNTNNPATVNRLQMDVGYINDPGSVEIVATLANGRTIRALADQEGIDRIFIAARGIRSFVVRPIGEEAAGYAMDNLSFGG